MRRTAAAAFLLLAAALAFAGEVEKLVEQMGGSDLNARYPAYRKLVERKDAAAAGPIAERIATWDLPAQSYGVSVLQSLPDDAAEGTWRRLLGSASPFVRVAAGRQVADKARGAKVIAEALATPGLTTEALEFMLARLGGLRDPGVSKAIRAHVRADLPVFPVSLALASLAGAEDRASLPVVRALAADGSPAHRAVAAAWLLRFGEEDRAQALADGIRAGAVEYLVFLRLRPWLEESDHLPPVVLDAFTERLGAEKSSVYLAAIAGLLGRARHAAAAPALKGLLENADATVTRAAFEALASIPGALDRDAVRAELASKDPARRLAAAEALRRTDDLSGLPVVVELLRTGGAVRSQAAEALGDFRTEAAVEPLLDAMACDDAATRSSARHSLADVLRTLFPYRRIDLDAAGWRYDDPSAEARAAAVERIRTWWRDHRDGAW